MTREEEIIEAASKYSEYEFNECAANNGFIKGVQWADSHPKYSWISVKKELPCDNPDFIYFGFTNEVLVRDKNENIFVAYMKKNKNNEWIWCNTDGNSDLVEITHWIYIPDIPHEK